MAKQKHSVFFLDLFHQLPSIFQRLFAIVHCYEEKQVVSLLILKNNDILPLNVDTSGGEVVYWCYTGEDDLFG